eukprot:CAMPEP_0198724786 /NCGR_PEP_ID=MMETSP1475-20131203/2208_1 /TAXON_ID= ORGANISM="Unidentified sp., Strain CCMP1999" /NCGR_SAMPLE_ID=MMETSP1475 /ASSEMBLY_ACC=CAM_ASM_001111 /LENGTH=334 /DNA_ID=CAMNT_0044486407 /DNA_START=50 /DNA_END=1051 /DNA_ORIENTATION=-
MDSSCIDLSKIRVATELPLWVTKLLRDEHDVEWILGKNKLALTSKALTGRYFVGSFATEKLLPHVGSAGADISLGPVNLFAFERQNRVYSVRLTNTADGADFNREHCIFEVVAGENSVRGLVRVLSPDDSLVLQIFSVNFDIVVTTVAYVPETNRFVTINSTKMIPDCNYCLLRREPCECPSSLWTRSMRVRHRGPQPHDNLWNRIVYSMEQCSGNMRIKDESSGSIRRTKTLILDDFSQRTPIKELCNTMPFSWDALKVIPDSFCKMLGLQSVGTPPPKLAMPSDPDWALVDCSGPGKREMGKLSCNTCGSKFMRPHALRRHIAGVHDRERNW